MNMKLMTLLALPLLALTGAAMPTKAELDAVTPVVADLMKPEQAALKAGAKTKSEVAAAALKLVDAADSEAAKLLLAKGAYNLYVRDGDFEKAIETLQTMREKVVDLEPKYLANIIESSLRTISRKHGGQLYQLLDETRACVRYQTGLKNLEAELKKNPTDKNLNLKLAEHHAILGDWPSALDAFERSYDRKAAEAATAEKTGAKVLKLHADYWWDYPNRKAPEYAKPFRQHAAKLYAQAIATGEISGLHKIQADRRIKEAEAMGAPAYEASAKDGGLYCVIDLSGGPNAKKYPVSYLDSVPKGGWTDEYKTNKLVLRKINPGKFLMGDQVNAKDKCVEVTLTKPYYIGIFEVTQRQWELVMNNNPSRFKGDVRRPVEQVSYNMIRGEKLGSGWPSSNAVDANSFLFRLREKSDIDLDLPTEAQWEYACRAGTKTGYYWGDVMDGACAWYDANAYKTTQPVGMRIPNVLGLYDMSGNVWEWCLDWYGDLSQGSVLSDPRGASRGRGRVRRGGSILNEAQYCSSFLRKEYNTLHTIYDFGFRLAIQPPFEPSKAAAKLGGVQLWENGPYWAECNVGASKPEESGYYFWWGDTVGYKRVGDRWDAVDGSRTGFSFNDKNCPTSGKDKAQLQADGYIDATGNLTPAHDAATAHLGAPWRMPTDADFAALIKNCDTEWITRNGVAGRFVKGRGAYAGKSIFFPSPGYVNGSGLYYSGSSGNVLSSSLNFGNSDFAWRLRFTSGSFDRNYSGCRYYGQSVRPVRGSVQASSAPRLSQNSADAAMQMYKRELETKIAAQKEDKLYCVIDLSGGPNAKKYPVSYLDSVPKGGWTDEYKTSKLVLRKINPGNDPLGRYAILSSYYIGVFELTQRQWQLVMQTNPSVVQDDPKMPVENVSAEDIVGSVAHNGFISCLKARTGLTGISLPSNEQWEFACRAGSDKAFCSGDDKSVARNYGWMNSRRKEYPVGLKLPNAWGVYDMHGNVWEQVTLGNRYSRRGGSSVNAEYICEVSTNKAGDVAIQDKNQFSGFRLAIHPPFKSSETSAKLGGVQLWENGPYWAECNVGASKPEESGYYFWWGDTVGYKRAGDRWDAVDGSRTGFSFNDKNCPTSGKDKAQLQAAGYIDATGNLTPAHDAATAHLGAPWRMPTDADFAALIKNCDTEWTTRNGVAGRLVKGRGAFAGKNIFLPAAGNGEGRFFPYAGSGGGCLSSTPGSHDSHSALYLVYNSSKFIKDSYFDRYRGQSVRPVRDPAQALSEQRSSQNGANAAVQMVKSEPETKNAAQQRLAKERATRDIGVYGEAIREIESLYVAFSKAGDKQAFKSLVSKYPKANRTGCAALYAAQRMQGVRQVAALTEVIEKFGDCYYGDGCNVGALARYHLVRALLNQGDKARAKTVADELRRDHSNAIGHDGALIVDKLK